MEVSGKIYDLAAEERNPRSIGQEAGGTPEMVWTWWRLVLGIKPWSTNPWLSLH